MDPGIAAKVAFLSRPQSYPEPTRRVEVVQTHMSWVFLTDRHAWKLKKPARTGYLDYRSVAARKRQCAEEVRLNRRFGSDVYLGIVALTVDRAGELHLGGAGRVIDWLVRMQRLPAERMLDHRIRDGTADAADIRRTVAVLWRVYRRCPRVAMSATTYTQRLAHAIAAHRRALGRSAHRLPRDAFVPTCIALTDALRKLAPMFEARVRGGRIIEGHGDLRPGHICLTREPRIIDCLEFSRAFRIVDVADELAYLGLECERLGAPSFTRVIFDAWARRSGDVPPPALVHFYQALRACLRAKLALAHLDDPGPHDGAAWMAMARAYLVFAHEHAALAR
jgi:uncharacterized protein